MWIGEEGGQTGKYGAQVGTHKNILQPMSFTSSDFDNIIDMQLKLVSFATELHTWGLKELKNKIQWKLEELQAQLLPMPTR